MPISNPHLDSILTASRFILRLAAVISTMIAVFPTQAQKSTTVRNTIIKSLDLQPGESKQFTFDLGKRQAGEQIRINLDARLNWRKLGGSNGCLRVSVNNQSLTKHHLVNKPHEFAYHRDAELSWSHGDAWRVVYAPSFLVDKTAKQALYHDANPFQYAWDVTSLVRPGRNRLTVAIIPKTPPGTHIVMRDVSVEIGKPLSVSVTEAIKNAPTGKLKRYMAKPPNYQVIQAALLPCGGIQVACGKLRATILTRTSLPDGQWHDATIKEREWRPPDAQTMNDAWETKSYRVERELHMVDNHIQVVDKIKNTGTELLGIIVEHRIIDTSPNALVKLAGHNAKQGSDRVHSSYHPSAFVSMDAGGLGILAENDIFRVHVESFRRQSDVGIKDAQLGIPQGTSATLEWSVYPLPEGDYWDFVNAVRRSWQSNITIPGPFVFAMYFRNRRSGSWYADWVQRRGAKILATGVPKYQDGSPAHGTGVLLAKDWIRQQVGWVSKLRRVLPDVASLIYFHAQISTEPDARHKYADSALHNADGSQTFYSHNDAFPMFVPTANNSYGLALKKYIDMALNTVKASGIYWDEMSFSTNEFTYQGPWDKHTVIIDPVTHAVIGMRSSTALLMQPFKLQLLHRLRDQHKMIIANTPAPTRTMQKQNIVRFVETPSYSNVIDAHLSCPIGLGNHHREESQADAARSMRKILDQGGVYYTHLYQRKPAPWNFTDIMYPITPVELHAGVVLGSERILTSKSGIFGWPTGEQAEVFVVNGEGHQSDKIMYKPIEESGKWRYEIRMPSDHFAILIKKPNE